MFRSAARATGIRADRGDHQRVQLPSQSPGARVERVVLSALAGQQPVGQAVAVVGAHQVTRADHPGQRDPQGLFPDAEIGCQPQQFGGVADAGWAPSSTDSTTERAVIRDTRVASPSYPGVFSAVVTERFVAVPHGLPESVFAGVGDEGVAFRGVPGDPVEHGADHPTGRHALLVERGVHARA